METDSLLMDAVPGSSTVAHRRLSAGILSRSSSRHLVRDSSDEELLEVELPSPEQAQKDDRDTSHGTEV